MLAVTFRIYPKVLGRCLIAPFNRAFTIQQNHTIRRSLNRCQKIAQTLLAVLVLFFQTTRNPVHALGHLAPQTISVRNVLQIAFAQPGIDARTPENIQRCQDQAGHHDANQSPWQAFQPPASNARHKMKQGKHEKSP